MSVNDWDISVPSILEIEEWYFYKEPRKGGDDRGDDDPDQEAQWFWTGGDMSPQNDEDW